MGAGIRQPRRAERRGNGLFDGDDGYSFKRQHGSISSFASASWFETRRKMRRSSP
jgi:hypothetical protein